MRLNLPKPFTIDIASLDASKKDAILIWGGSTAAGHHAIQLAVLSGLTVFVTASPAAHEYVKSLGASYCFDYRDEGVVEKIRATEGAERLIYGFDTVAEKGSTDKVVVSSKILMVVDVYVNLIVIIIGRIIIHARRQNYHTSPRT
jgi:NADPH:quinone reductase-like Zn-dependent oxidoreductase